jgi:hypothetical protein
MHTEQLCFNIPFNKGQRFSFNLNEIKTKLYEKQEAVYDYDLSVFLTGMFSIENVKFKIFNDESNNYLNYEEIKKIINHIQFDVNGSLITKTYSKLFDSIDDFQVFKIRTQDESEFNLPLDFGNYLCNSATKSQLLQFDTNNVDYGNSFKLELNFELSSMNLAQYVTMSKVDLENNNGHLGMFTADALKFKNLFYTGSENICNGCSRYRLGQNYLSDSLYFSLPKNGHLDHVDLNINGHRLSQDESFVLQKIGSNYKLKLNFPLNFSIPDIVMLNIEASNIESSDKTIEYFTMVTHHYTSFKFDKVLETY